MSEKYFPFLEKNLACDDSYLISWLKSKFEGIEGQIVLWGTGIDGKKCFQYLESAQIEITCVVDNHIKDKTFLGKPICHPIVIETLHNPIIFVASRKYEEEIVDQILNQYSKVNNLQIVCYSEIYKKIFRDYFLNVMSKDHEMLRAYNQWKKKNIIYLHGQYESWDEANSSIPSGKGYSADNILDLVAKSTQEVRSGKAAFERDGVTFDEIEYNFHLLAALQYVTMHEGSINVLDFGGALGSTYFQNRFLFSGINMTWNIVEQKNYVEYGQKYVPEISFFLRCEECFKSQEINCVLFSSSLQYIEGYRDILENIISRKTKFIIIDRTPMSDADDDIITCQNVPENIYEAEYPLQVFSKKNFEKLFLNGGYEFVLRWKNDESFPVYRNSIDKVEYYGYLLKKV